MRHVHRRAGRARHRAAAGLLAACLLGPTAVSAAARGEEAPEEIPGSTRVTAESVIALAGREADLVIIDARLASDRRHGYLEGSVSRPDTRTDCPGLARVAASPDTPLLFYCNGPHCRRSAAAVRIALDCGYRDVYWFRGGMEEWRAKNFPYLTEGP